MTVVIILNFKKYNMHYVKENGGIHLAYNIGSRIWVKDFRGRDAKLLVSNFHEVVINPAFSISKRLP